jgi:DNA-binding response OmpR family regulator
LQFKEGGVNDKRKVPILIVDDEKAVRNLLARVAERAGFAADTAKDGIEALEMLRTKEYEIVIVDLMMPRLNGYELVQRISELKPRPAVLVATALMNGDTASLDDSMVRRVIKKPFDIKAVANALIDTARFVAEQRAAAEKGVPVAPPEIAKLPVMEAESVEVRSIEEKPETETEPPADPKPPEKPKA